MLKCPSLKIYNKNAVLILNYIKLEMIAPDDFSL